MKPKINRIKKNYIQVIRHNLSQPEEIDQILMEMAADDPAHDTAIENGLLPIQSARNPERGSFPTVEGFSHGAAHGKSAHHLPDHCLFVASGTGCINANATLKLAEARAVAKQHCITLGKLSKSELNGLIRACEDNLDCHASAFASECDQGGCSWRADCFDARIGALSAA